MREFSGDFVQCTGRYAIVAGRFNAFITERLVAGARDAFVRHGIGKDDIDLIWVPGAFEIPFAVRRVVDSGRYQAAVALGAVIRGATPHFDYVAGACVDGLARINAEGGIPVVLGVLTTDTIEQAVERAGTKSGNKGAEAALTAMEMASLASSLGD
ncbi:MAG: 6,7-dimethyl-8-ribityllumazine synthase [Gammaproteobacteria bacterium]|nr:6,7-dimethyl-8-ribityllumazine synthase [Gammaproteobacteria bacterium]MDE0281315.1 6,7-dimethyl-8-ribityllumazine synthase [Gammaproteobacteria bacterium]MXX17598.1 6,7-dimethyl-8-ribityllumazine synthase [Gammaproteobacteria bacterium]MXY65518.1 6,7-dimethyl-8-ribityllumazine synthase [Gammaproteobacteria bacterium]MYG66031.1 6,7-dimethyl-8-ribityllumazine synthase [Gammaproteobacteria bacterium]